MTLLVDIGNTRIKWARRTPAGLAQGGCRMHRGRSLAAELDNAWGNAAPPGSVVFANVAGPAAAETLHAWCRAHWQCEPREIRPAAAALGVYNAYAEPLRLGVDRWAALVGAFCEYGMASPLCVIDCGTAVTLDVVTAQGRHLGGLILPGTRLMRQSLYRDTGGIPDEGASDPVLLGTDTRGCISSGVHRAVLGALRLALDELGQAHAGLHCILTGGDAPELADLLGRDVRLDPDLVLRGIDWLSREES